VLQEVLIECVMKILHECGIETRSIREEVTAFVNEGIFMTGGPIAAQILAVGRLNRIFQHRARIKKSRSGKNSLLANSQGA